jgi:hypothetical protein
LIAPATAPSPNIIEAGPLSTSMRSSTNASTGRELCAIVFWRMPSRRSVMLLSVKPRIA